MKVNFLISLLSLFALVQAFKLNFNAAQDKEETSLLSELTNLGDPGPQISNSFVTSQTSGQRRAQTGMLKVKDQSAIISCALPPGNLSVALIQMCNLCDVAHAYNLSKTNWVEIDMPVEIESLLMDAFSTLKAQFPGSPFYLGVNGGDFCFSTDHFTYDYDLRTLASALKKDFYLSNSSFFALPQQQVVPTYLVISSVKRTANEQDYSRNFLVDSQFWLGLKQEYQSAAMGDQFVLSLENMLIDTYEGKLTFSGRMKLVQSGIELPCLVRSGYNGNKVHIADIEMSMVDKNYSLKEFVYTFSKMGVSIDLPVIKGVEDYQHVAIKLAQMKWHFLVYENGTVDFTKGNLVSFQAYFLLPDFATLPELYVRQSEASLSVLFPKDEEDLQTVQVWIAVNGKVTFQSQNYFLNKVVKVVSDSSQKMEQVKLFPQTQVIYPLEEALQSLASIISYERHEPVFPKNPPCQFIIRELGLNSSSVQVFNPHIKVLSSPIKIAKISSDSMKIFSVHGDAQFSSVLGVLSQGKLAGLHTLSFQNTFAEHALKEIFNFDKLSMRDKEEINAFKVVGLRLLLNNEDLTEQIAMIAPDQKFSNQGIQIEVDLEVKQYCEANSFCTLLQNAYGSMYMLTLTGQVHDFKHYVGLSTTLSPLQFQTYKPTAKSPSLKNVTLNLNIDFSDKDKPDIEVTLKGLLKVKVQENFNVTFETVIEMDEGENMKVSGVMDSIFGNAFNLNNTINVTQMTLTSSLNSQGQLSLLDISGVSIFGAECYKIPQMATMFNSSQDSPTFTSQQQQKLFTLINSTFINQQNCDIGNVFLKVNISESQGLKEHTFRGSVHAQDLSHFLKMFYPGIADKIKAVTPSHIREQPFLNSQLELRYDPGTVTINGHEIIGAYTFEGLIDFHGLLAQVRIVLDPDQQTYLYFSYLLPSLTFSHGNIKFLSPLDYLEGLQQNTGIQGVLESFGAPRIEIEILLQQISTQKTPVKFLLRGVVSLMGGIQQMVTADIQNSRMNFTIFDRPFGGVFAVTLRVATQINNGPLNDNLASYYGQFEMDQNIQNIEERLNVGIKTWYQTGLKYLVEWAERLEKIGDLNSTYSANLCDPDKCPTYSQCTSNLYLKCLEHEIVYECEKEEPICTELLQKCTNIQKICARTVYGECLSYVEICHEWENICIGYNAKQCSKFRTSKVNTSCTIFDLACDMESVVDASCFSHCEQMQENYVDYLNLVANYSEIFNRTNQILSPFATLRDEFEAIENSNNSRPFLQILNVTMEGLMDLIVKEEAANITFQIKYQSQIDNQTRYLRSAIDFTSVVQTSQSILPFILEDLAKAYGIPTPIATQMLVVIEQLEGSSGVKVANNLATYGQIDAVKVHQNMENVMKELEMLINMTNSSTHKGSHEFDLNQQMQGVRQRAEVKQRQRVQEKELFNLVDQQMSAELRMNKMMEEQEIRKSRESKNKKGGLSSEKQSQNNILLTESQLGQLSEFLKSS